MTDDRDRLQLSLDDTLARAIREAAFADGVSADEWVAHVVSERLGIEPLAQDEGPEPEVVELEPEPVLAASPVPAPGPEPIHEPIAPPPTAPEPGGPGWPATPVPPPAAEMPPAAPAGPPAWSEPAATPGAGYPTPRPPAGPPVWQGQAPPPVAPPPVVGPPAWPGQVVPPPQPGPGYPPPPPPPPPPPVQPPAAPSPAERLADPSAWQPVTDPTETFLIALPVGWQARAWVEPTPAMAYPMAQAVSPDGGTTLFSGDSGIPMFLDPASSMFAPPGMALRPPTPAADFLAEWVRFRYGLRSGFRQLDLRENPLLRDVAAETIQRLGSPLTWLYAARLTAAYAGEDGRPVRAVFLATTRGVGPGWIAQVYGVTSVEDPEPYVPAVLKLVATAQATTAQALRNQQEQARIAAGHRAAMQQIDANTRASQIAHQGRMQGIQQQAAAHQERMQTQQQSYDAAAASWQAQQATSDASHSAAMEGLRTGAAQPGAGGTPQQDYVNMIREETTVLDAEGQAHQVEAGADRYYHNEYTNTWVGLEEHQDITEVTGSDDYTEGTIQS